MSQLGRSMRLLRVYQVAIKDSAEHKVVEPAWPQRNEPLDKARQRLRVHCVSDQPAAMCVHRNDPVVQHCEALWPGRVEPEGAFQVQLLHANASSS